MDKGKKINWKNGLLFSAVSYLLYILSSTYKCNFLGADNKQ